MMAAFKKKSPISKEDGQNNYNYAGVGERGPHLKAVEGDLACQDLLTVIPDSLRHFEE